MLLRLNIAALWSPEGKELTSRLLFVMFIVILLFSHLVSWDRCGTWLYRFLILAVFLTSIWASKWETKSRRIQQCARGPGAMLYTLRIKIGTRTTSTRELSHCWTRLWVLLHVSNNVRPAVWSELQSGPFILLLFAHLKRRKHNYTSYIFELVLKQSAWNFTLWQTLWLVFSRRGLDILDRFILWNMHRPRGGGGQGTQTLPVKNTKIYRVFCNSGL